MAWTQDASPAFDADCVPLFPDIHFRHDGNILQSLLAVGDEKKAAVTILLQKMCAGLVEVTERQLADFLPQGRYYDVQDMELRAKLQHSHITNLVSEENFADLDFSMFKRRSSTLHHHSTINMIKRNKSVTWLTEQTEEQQQKLLEMSSRKAHSLREKHIRMEKEVVRQKKELLRQARQKKAEAEEKKRQQILGVMDDLKPHHGPCGAPSDVDRLLQTYTTDKALKKALRAEIQFQKIVLNKISPHLRVTGTSLTLVNRLLQFFGGQEIGRLPPLLPQDPGPPAKRPRRELPEPPSDSDPDSESDDDDDGDSPDFEKNFKFTRQGEMVAVYYEDAFHIGEVTEFSADKANAMFMERADKKESAIFRWPAREDIWPIVSEVVFAGDLSLAPSSSSGRSFVVEAPDNLNARYNAFKEYLVENML